MVMTAVCADRKKFIAPAYQNHVFATCLTGRHRSVREIANEKTITKIVLLRFFCACHFYATLSFVIAPLPAPRLGHCRRAFPVGALLYCRVSVCPPARKRARGTRGLGWR